MRVALTGSFGSGKSSAARFLEKRGWERLDTDAVCRNLYEAPPADLAAALAGRWGRRIFSGDGGGIDRKVLAGIVFADACESDWLNSIVHPLIRQKVAAWAAARKGNFIVEVPLLFEAQWEADYDCSVCVWAPAGLLAGRLAGRGFTPQEVEARLARQMPADAKLAKADFGLINAKSIGFLEMQCDAWSASIMGHDHTGQKAPLG